MIYRCSLWGGTLAPIHVGLGAAYSRLRQRQERYFAAALPALRRVTPGLWRGGQPTKYGLVRLKNRGIRRVIDLRTEQALVQQEAEHCWALGLEHCTFPMGESLPDFSQVDQLLKLLDQAAHCPTYIHCREGKDRVGCVTALYRVTRQGWSLERAGAELLRFGFDTQLRSLAEDTAFYASILRRPGLYQSLHQESKPSLSPALIALLVLGSVAIARPAHAQYSFSGLGDLLGGSFSSRANAVSADGSVIVGASNSSGGSEAFRWTQSGGMVGLGNMVAGGISVAQGVSADGTVVVGGGDAAAGPRAFRWTSGTGMVNMGLLPNGLFASEAWSASSDGSIVVGASGVQPSGQEAFRWTSGGGMVSIGDFPGGVTEALAFKITDDGSVIVGFGNSSNGREAFRWTSGTGMVGLGDLSGGSFYSYASSVSSNGGVIVGYSNSSNGDEAFRWTQTGGMVGLGDLAGGGFESRARGISGDGSVIVGSGTSAIGTEAFLWTQSGGMVNLKSFLVSNGVTGLTNWTLTAASTISTDGTTIVGWGTNPSGNTEAWRATIATATAPEPGTLSLLTLGACATLVARRRKTA